MQVRNPVNNVASPLISLVFPTYNPGSTIETTWRQVQDFRRRAPAAWEFIFVCDGCTDGTPERLRQWTRGGDGVRVLSYTTNRGKGHAVRLGLREARGQYRLFTDVDLAYSFADITRLAESLRNGAEVAIASRLHPDSRVMLPPRLLTYCLRRQVQSHVFNLAVRMLLPIKVRDTQAGLKGLTAHAATALLPRLSCSGFEFDCELLTACVRLGFDVAEVPVMVRYDNNTTTTGTCGMTSMVRKLLSIRRTWREVPVAAALHGADLRQAVAA